MVISGRVLDADTAAPLSGATISMDGAAVAATDSQGNYSIDTPQDAVNITVSYVGYDSSTMPEEIVISSPTILLHKTFSLLDPVTVFARIKTNPLPFALAAGGLVLLLYKSKKKTVGKIDTTTILLIAGGAAAVYFLTRPKPAPALPVYAPSNYLSQGVAPGNTTGGEITAAATGISTIIDAFQN